MVKIHLPNSQLSCPLEPQASIKSLLERVERSFSGFEGQNFSMRDTQGRSLNDFTLLGDVFKGENDQNKAILVTCSNGKPLRITVENEVLTPRQARLKFILFLLLYFCAVNKY